jgi:hypothetical protein
MFIKFANGTRKELPPCKEAAIEARQLQTGWVVSSAFSAEFFFGLMKCQDQIYGRVNFI